MEYVDGEDLASLLRRIGRLPQDKADRDRAPALRRHRRRPRARRAAPRSQAGQRHDRRRRQRPHHRLRSRRARRATSTRRAPGTPQYMAPEQLAGGRASVKSDIYALGLVLFELFTGQACLRGEDAQRPRSPATRAARSSTPSSMVRDLDPAVERVILRCLERDPALRPGSALAVAAALPGGDPLAGGAGGRRNAVAGDGGGRRRDAAHSAGAWGCRCSASIIAGLLTTAVLSDRDAASSPESPMERAPTPSRIARARSLDEAGLRRSAGRHGARFLVLQGLHLLRAAHAITPQTAGTALSNGYVPVAAVLVSRQPRTSEPLGCGVDASVRRSADDGLRHDVGRAGRPGPPHAVHDGDATESEELQSARRRRTGRRLFDAARPRRDHVHARAVSSGCRTATPTSGRRGKGPCRGRPTSGCGWKPRGYRGRPAFFRSSGRGRGVPREAAARDSRAGGVASFQFRAAF